MENNASAITKQAVAQLVKNACLGSINLLFRLPLMPLKTIIHGNTPAEPMEFDLSNFMLKLRGFSLFIALLNTLLIKKASLKLDKKVKCGLQTNHIVRILIANNTPQASNQFRLITAQTEGLLVSGRLK